MSGFSLPVTAIVMTKNERSNIEKCMSSLQGVGEVFVVDSGSIDGTQALAASMGAHIIDFQWDGKYPKKKQWCLDNLPFTHDWAFYVDADEEATPELLTEIESTISSPDAKAGYFVGYDYLFLGKVLRHGQRAYKLVFFNRYKGRFEQYDDLDAPNMWEVVGHYQPLIDGPVETLKSPMLHTDHDSMFHYFDRNNRYSDWEAVVRTKKKFVSKEETQLGNRGRLKAAFDRLPLKAPAAFVYSYVFKRGFLDGREGLHFALAKAFYYWQIEVKADEIRRANQDG